MLIRCMSDCRQLSRGLLKSPSGRCFLRTLPRRTINTSRVRPPLLPVKNHQLWLLRLYRTKIYVKPKVETVKINKNDVVRLLSLAKSEKLVLAGATLCLIASSAVTMAVPFAIGKILDIIFNKSTTGEETIDKLRNVSLVLCGVFLIGGLANCARIYLFGSATLRIVRDLRLGLYRNMLRQEVGWFDTKGTGELLNRLINDTFFVGNSLSYNVSDGLRATVSALVGSSMMVYTSPQLALISLCVVPGIAGAAVIFGRYVRSITRAMLDKFAEMSKSAEERFANIKTVKIFCKEDMEMRKFNEMYKDALDIGYRDVKARAVFFGSTGFTGNAVIIAVLYYGGQLVVNDVMTMGALTTFILYAIQTGVSINGISSFYTELNKGLGASHRLWEILDRRPAIPYDSGFFPEQSPKGEIKFENVSYRYPSRTNAILDNFNVTLLPGQMTAVVGRSGSGKSTLAYLLLRLFDPDTGRVLLDGEDIRNLNAMWLRRHMSAVSQEPVLFSGSIRENILYGLATEGDFQQSKFDEAIRKAHVDEFVSKLPQGMDTIVGQRGVMLSGGQKQRVAIARALVKDPTILILDEATSALDSASEELVQNALDEVRKGRTLLTIAHRLSTIRNADKIVVVDNGCVIEEGPYEELITGGVGAFKELVRKQTFSVPLDK